VVSFRFTDESCLIVSADVSVAPGHHASGGVPGVFSGPVNCIAILPPSNTVSRQNLTIDFYVLDGSGQATAAIRVDTYSKNLPVCQ
jgi:hypothetical protein